MRSIQLLCRCGLSQRVSHLAQPLLQIAQFPRSLRGPVLRVLSFRSVVEMLSPSYERKLLLKPGWLDFSCQKRVIAATDCPIR